MKIDSAKILGMLIDRCMTWKELGNRSSLSPQGIRAAIKRGTCNPSTVGKLARGLQVPVSEIIKEDSHERR